MTDLHSHHLILHVVSSVHSSTFLAHVLFLQRESCLKSECVFAEHYMERCILLSSAVHFFFFFFFFLQTAGIALECERD